MILQNKILEKNILLPMRAKTRIDAIQELLNHLCYLDILKETIKLFANISNQEKKSTSSAGRGVAFPHSISNEINEFACVLGISNIGIDFNSPDGHNCHLILLTLSPINQPIEHRKFITHFRSMVQNSDIRLNLIDSENSSEVIKIISKWEENYNNKDDII